MLRAGTLTMLLLLTAILSSSLAPAEQVEDHPLLPVLKYAQQGHQQITEQIKDYTCTVVKRERVNGRLQEPQAMTLKLRHEQVRDGKVVVPLGVYLNFQAPASIKGREVVYVRGKNRGMLIAHRGGPHFDNITTALHPTSEIAMRGTRYPLTDIGIKQMVAKLYEVGKEELQYDDCEVEFVSDVKVNGRSCTMIQVTHPTKAKHFRYHLARIFIDDELHLPIRFASYGWPKEEGGKLPVLEEYTYLNMKLNVGLTDWDFDHRNEAYEFWREFKP